MSKRVVRGVIGAAVLCVALGVHLGPPGSQVAEEESARIQLALAVPAFAQTAGTNEFPYNEVGICAYVKLDQDIEIGRAAAAFVAIEAQEEGYVIGTVSLPSQSENMWPHLYISSTGWIMTYYPRTEPTSRMIQWIGYQGGDIGTTTLRDALVQASQQIGVNMTAVSSSMAYYHFQYPSATKLLIAVDTTTGSDSFTYTIPSELNLLEASWSHYAYKLGTYENSHMNIDSERHCTFGRGDNQMSCATIEIQYTSPGVAHTVSLYSGLNWAATAIIFLY